MKPLLVAFVLAFVLAFAPAAHADDPPAPVSENALHFRLDVGVPPGHIVAGWLDETEGTGTGYDAAFLDLDGDGIVETKQDSGVFENRVTGEKRPAPKLSIPLNGATWVLDLTYSNLAIRDGKANPYIRWSVTAEGIYVWFINGRAKLYTSAEAAREAAPIRLGPPFSFQTGSATRGRQALVRVGLKDANGATMRLARADGEERRPEIRLAAAEGEEFLATAEYG